MCHSYQEITSDKEYVVGIGPWKDNMVPVPGHYVETPSDIVARAHIHNLQVCFVAKPSFR
jgi:glycerophosphoryl diester phosphodiesterase